MPLYIGTCSWKYPSWEGLVYSRAQGINYLEEYSRKYNTVEIDQWFWSLHGPDRISLPQRETVLEYAASVPADFRFSVKIPNSITLTHFYRQSKTEALIPNTFFLSIELFKRFWESLEPMHALLGPLMFQFEYLNKQKMPSQTAFQEQFGPFLAQLPGGFSWAVEIRNPNYLNELYFRFLEKTGVSHVFLQGYYMPPITETFQANPQWINTCSVIRLHGPDRSGMEEKSKGAWDRILEPRDEELPGIVSMIQELLDRNIDTYVNVNNHYEGSAPFTIEKIRTGLTSLS